MRSARSIALAICLACGLGAGYAQDTRVVDFTRDVQPLFRAHCLDCHGPDEQKNGFRLDRRRDAMRGGTGTVIGPGSSASSRLYLRLIGDRYGQQMPPEGPLSLDQINIIQAWIDQGAKWPDEVSGETPPLSPDPQAARMMDALRTGDRLRFRQLFRDEPQSAKLAGPGGSTPLMYAVLYGDAEIVRLLLAGGADPNARNEAGATALMWAVDDLEMTRLLLASGADANARSSDGQTPLLIATGRFGSSDIVRLLLDHGADPSAQAHSVAGPVTPLRKAADLGDEATLRLLIERGANLKAAGIFPLIAAVSAGSPACVDLLIQSADSRALSAAFIIVAPPRGEPDALSDKNMLKKLIAHGANVNAQDPDGRTALMLAAATEDVSEETICTLVEWGANVAAKDAIGSTAFDYAKQHGRAPIMKLLEDGSPQERDSQHLEGKPWSAKSPREALTRSIPLLQRADATFLNKSGCVSCHHNSLTALTISTARKCEIPVNDKIARQQLKSIGTYLDSRRERLLQGVGGGGESSTVGFTLLGMAADGYSNDLATDAAARYLKNRQLPDGHWPRIGHRPPLGSTDIQVTAIALRSLQAFGPQSQLAEYEKAINLAADWLRKAQPKTTSDRVFQLLGLHWAGGNEPLLMRATGDLVAEQKPDGGWSQLPTLPSDAYATGQALFALHEAGRLSLSDSAYKRGTLFLLNTQLEDGSWYVKSRSIPFQPYFESDFPHGPDQWISAAATNWASMALIPAAAH